MKPTPGALAILSLVCAGAVVLAVLWLDGLRHDCAARWSGSGFQHDYRQGQCMVLAGSRWLPEKAVSVKVPAKVCPPAQT
jgi:hypothetical protein